MCHINYLYGAVYSLWLCYAGLHVKLVGRAEPSLKGGRENLIVVNLSLLSSASSEGKQGLSIQEGCCPVTTTTLMFITVP